MKQRHNPFQVVQEFEQAVAEYAGAPYCVAVSSCTMALLLAIAYHLRELPLRDRPWVGRPVIDIPRRTYVSVPMSIIHAGARPTFRDENWQGAYRLNPLPIYDSARRLRSNMYSWSSRWSDRNENAPSLNDEMVCLSFHWSKILGIQQGGAILHSSKEADAWLRRARFDGRTENVAPKDDTFSFAGWHAYMSPEIAAEGLVRLSFLPDDNPDLLNDDYPDLSQMECFR